MMLQVNKMVILVVEALVVLILQVLLIHSSVIYSTRLAWITIFHYLRISRINLV